MRGRCSTELTKSVKSLEDQLCQHCVALCHVHSLRTLTTNSRQLPKSIIAELVEEKKYEKLTPQLGDVNDDCELK